MGDPAHVPAGRYARSALKRLGLWQEVRSRLAAAADTRAALALVERGEAIAGFVYLTDALASRRVSVAARFPVTGGAPISYPIAMVKSGNASAARAVYEFMTGPVAQAIFKRHGFEIP